MARKPCLVCGEPSNYSRCERHSTRTTSKPGAQRYGRQHERITKQTIAAWVRIHGWVCPGWHRPAHRVGEGGLTGEHIIARSIRPDLAYEPSNYTVLCQPCNSRKGNR